MRKILFFFIISMLLMIPALSFGDGETTKEGISCPDKIMLDEGFISDIYTLRFSKFRFALGISLQPVLETDFQPSEPLNLIKTLPIFNTRDYLGSLGGPIDDALVSFVDIPRVFSLSIHF